MKRNKTMIVAVLAIILTLAVGYALFSQTINITGSATAQGSFEITADCSLGVTNDFKNLITSNYRYTFDTEDPNSYTNDTCTPSGNTVSASINFKYPGAVRYYTVKFTNTGTIDAVFENSQMLLDRYCVDGSKKVNANNTPNGNIETENECYNLMDDNDTIVDADINYVERMLDVGGASGGPIFEDPDHNYYAIGVDNGTIGVYVNQDASEIYLPAGHSMYLVQKMDLSSSFGTANMSGSFLVTHDQRISFNFKQKQ